MQHITSPAILEPQDRICSADNSKSAGILRHALRQLLQPKRLQAGQVGVQSDILFRRPVNMFRLTLAPGEVRPRRPIPEGAALSDQVLGVLLGDRADRNVQYARVAGAIVRLVNRVDRYSASAGRVRLERDKIERRLTVAVPDYKVPRSDLGYVHHRPLKLQMGMQCEGGKLHAVSSGVARDLASHLFPTSELPVVRV